MARFPFLRLRQPKAEKRISSTWDLKGTTLLELIAQSNGGAVSQENAMKFTGVLAAVSLRSELLASFPKIIYIQTDKGRQPDYDNPLYKIIAYNPNPYMNGFTFWELINTHLDLWGNAYVFISRARSGEVKALTPVHPKNVEVLVEGGKMVYKVSRTGDPVLDKSHGSDKFLHFKDISFDGVKGQSRISLANSAIAIAQSAEAFGKEFFDKGGHAKGIITMPGQMSPEALKNFAEHWNLSGNHGTPILDMGKTYQQLDIPMADAQFIATREFQLQDIARVFRVPPHLLADLSRSTFSNVEHSDIQWSKYGLRPMVKRYEAELESKLLGEQAGERIIRFNLDGILRGDTASRAQYYAAMKQNKIMTSNEIRRLENMNPIEGGDILENPATTSEKKTEQ